VSAQFSVSQMRVAAQISSRSQILLIMRVRSWTTRKWRKIWFQSEM